jgi:hypothetical protein
LFLCLRFFAIWIASRHCLTAMIADSCQKECSRGVLAAICCGSLIAIIAESGNPDCL